MLRLALLLAAPTLIVSQLNDVQISNIDNLPPPGLKRTNVTVSFYMNCFDQSGLCFLGRGNTGTFNRGEFLVAFGTALGRVAQQTPPQEDVRVVDAFSFDSTDNFCFHRVVQSSDQFEIPQVKFFDVQSSQQFLVDDPAYWNVLIRFSANNIPVVLADQMRTIIAELQEEYAGVGIFRFDSLWIDREAFFLPYKFEPVPGRGGKDQQLLIPLVAGIFCMLAIPAFLSFLLVQMAKGNQKNERRIARRQRAIELYNDALVTNATSLEQKKEVLDKEKEMAEKEEEMKSKRDHTDLDHEDVDWKAQPPAQVPY